MARPRRFDDRLRQVHPKTRAGWRSWLASNHETSEGVWLVYYRTSTGKRRLSWEDAVREALCFGWIDSKVQGVDDERYRQIFTPRKPRSVWSKINKEYVDELVEADLMTEAGQRAIDVAKANGAWTFLEPIDGLVVPADLAAALDGSARALAAYELRSPTAKRAILYPIYTAKRDDTRAKRVTEALAELEGDAPAD